MLDEDLRLPRASSALRWGRKTAVPRGEKTSGAAGRGVASAAWCPCARRLLGGGGYPHPDPRGARGGGRDQDRVAFPIAHGESRTFAGVDRAARRCGSAAGGATGSSAGDAARAIGGGITALVAQRLSREVAAKEEEESDERIVNGIAIGFERAAKGFKKRIEEGLAEGVDIGFQQHHVDSLAESIPEGFAKDQEKVPGGFAEEVTEEVAEEIAEKVTEKVA
mmetsp:Transcript_49056/g.137327  ORF Transcript_49056/g.137327 Transcript_49056/m.137327 type:complete len:222 (-) Transcript_49056:654-1319(-)